MNVVHHNRNRFSNSNVHRAASAQGVAEIESRLSNLESLFELTESPKLGAVIRAQREMLAKARRPERTFSPEVQAGVTTYLQNKGPIPGGLEPPQQELLEQFGALHQRGVQFVDSQMRDLSGTEAFLELAKRDYHSEEEAIRIKTYSKPTSSMVLSTSISLVGANVMTSGGRQGGISTATVRPEYLPSIKFFMDKTLEGEKFFRPEGSKAPKKEWVEMGLEEGPNSHGMIPIKTVQTFLADYGADPQQAVVGWGFQNKYTAIGERPDNESLQGKINAIDRLLKGEFDKDNDLLEFGDDFISVGGIMLDRAD